MSRSVEDKGQSAQWGWTLGQRRALILLVVIGLLALVIRYVGNRTYLSDPPPLQGARAAELATRIDPNTAEWETLAAIPSLGEKRAKEIVAYRERARANARDGIVFREISDLMRIKGIGPATTENLRPYLIFPPTGPGARGP